MKLIVQKKALLKLLDRCVGVIDKKSSIPVLTNVLVDARGGELRLSAQSLTQSVTGTIESSITKKGAVLVNCINFKSRVESMPDGDVLLNDNEKGQLIIKQASGSRKFQIATLPADEFPTMPVPDETSGKVSIASSVIASLINATQSAISLDDTRVSLSCALVEISPNLIRFVSTDSKRMNKAEAVIECDARLSMMIPLPAIQQLRKIVGEGEVSVDILKGNNTAFFDAGNVRFSLKLIDGQFPPYEQVIPNSHECSAVLMRADLVGSVKAISGAVAKDKGIKLTIKNDSVILESQDADFGNGEDIVLAEVSGENVVGADPKFLLDALAAITSDSITIQASGDLGPIVIVPTNQSEGFNVLTIVMPMRV
jgi:DNA polymerase-3 subunit beta